MGFNRTFKGLIFCPTRLLQCNKNVWKVCRKICLNLHHLLESDTIHLVWQESYNLLIHSIENCRYCYSLTSLLKPEHLRYMAN
jgi:hypothetical protein